MSITPMHRTGALVSKEALICAVPNIKMRLITRVPQAESPAGDWQIVRLRSYRSWILPT